MKLLLILLSLMSFTVETKNSVKAEGTFPYDMEVTYSNTYQRGQVRQGDQATLTLSNLGGITIEKVNVCVKSNKKSGAGTFTVYANNQQTAELELTHEQMTIKDEINPECKVNLLEGKLTGIEELKIQLDGKENSLYISSYDITWNRDELHYTVTLMNSYSVYTTLTEKKCGEGVVLPEMADYKEWKFAGWTDQEIWKASEQPQLWSAGSVYQPMHDDYLWATYVLSDEETIGYMTDIQSGTYLYVNSQMNIALYGVPDENGNMVAAKTNSYDEQQYYDIEFVSSESAYITHTLTQTPIGFEKTKMSPKASLWQVYHDGEETIFYTIVNNKKYVLWLNIQDKDYEVEKHAGLLYIDSENLQSPMRLLKAPMAHEVIIWSCHPDDTERIETPIQNMQERTVRLGNYELHIVNGKKRLRAL